MTLSRREFLQGSAAVSLGFVGLRTLFANDETAVALADAAAGRRTSGLGPLVTDPEGVFDLPKGFQYRILSRVGETMDDGLRVPNFHDGMGTFPGPDDKTLLLRNHEVPYSYSTGGAFGDSGELLDKVDRSKLYDLGGELPYLGGVTTLLYDTRAGKLEGHWLSLAGTTMNCSGGVMPWGSWISCEETTLRKGTFDLEDGSRIRVRRDHGYNFEVPARAGGGLVEPVPIRPMGRFLHEAVACHVPSGAIYQTEDRSDGVFYRFLPDHPGELLRGGRLQALALRKISRADTRNWEGTATPLEAGTTFQVDWLDLDNVESPADDLRLQAYEKGAARFARGEGLWCDDTQVFFDCTTGGAKKLGQIFRYVPSPHEGKPDEKANPGTLELFLESPSRDLLTNSDNLTITPWGDLFVCEDHALTADVRRKHLVGFTPDGRAYHVGRNRMNEAELAGCVFSPDHSTLFVNIQWPGLTLAITGPWPSTAKPG